MTLIIGLVIFVVGLLVGLIVNKFMGSTSQENQELTNKLDQGEKALEEYKANVAGTKSSLINLIKAKKL